MEKYILSIDQGTTSTRAILFDKKGKSIFKAQREVECFYPKPGWVEQDALALWVSVIDVVNEILVKANISIDNIDSIGIANQRETTVIWDKKTGLPIYRAIVWQSRQSSEICDKYFSYKDFIHKKTGLLINSYFSASKIRFILDKVANAQERSEKGELLFGTIDSWIIYKMSKGSLHLTDISNASRTMLFNIVDKCWDKELCSIFNIPMRMLPNVYPSSYDYGKASFFSENVHIHGVAGDQQAALFGQTCFEKGECKNTYGTGCFMLMNIGDKPIFSKNGLLTTIAWKIKDEVCYAFEGSVFIGGAIVKWLKDGMKLIENYEDSEKEAYKCLDSHGIYVVPAFVGLATPYWNDEVRGSVFGLTRESNKEEFIRASLEGIAYQCKDVFETMKKDSHIHLKTLKVDGGATSNNYLMQFQSDILSLKIKIPLIRELTSLGSAYLAGLSSGFFSSFEEIKKIHSTQKTYFPSMSKDEIKKRYKGWKRAVRAALMFK